MAQLNRTTWDSTYNNSLSGSFKNNTSQLIIESTMRQFAKDAEDSLGFLNTQNLWTASNIFQAFTTSTSSSEVNVTRTGAVSLSQGMGANINLGNATSNKATLIQGADDTLQMFNFNASTWTERLRINASGLIMVGNQLAISAVVVDTSIMGIKCYNSTADATTFHLGGLFESEQTVATSNSIQGVEGYAKVSHTGGTTTLALGVVGNFELSSNATVSLAYSVGAGGNLTGTGTVSAWHMFHAEFSNSGGGIITQAVGLYIENFPSLGGGGKYSIKSMDTGATALLHGFLIMPDLPSSSAGLITGSFWQDPADSHRIKFVP